MVLHRTVALLVVLLSCANCASPEEHVGATDRDEVIAGTPAAGRDPAVVAVATPYQLCTGTLVAPDIVLTARHCVARTTGCPSPESLQWNPVLPQDASQVLVGSGDDVERASGVVAKAIVLPEPFVCEHDIAAVLLSRPIDGAFVLPLAREAPAEGSFVRVVGFGMTESGSYGEKRIRERVAVTAVNGATFRTGEGGCSGDSGGPAIDERTGAIAGVLSNGSPECSGPTAFAVYTSVLGFRPLIDRANALR